MHAGKQVNTHFTLHTHAVSKAPGFTHAVSHKALSQSRNSTHALSHARTFTRTHFHTHALPHARTLTSTHFHKEANYTFSSLLFLLSDWKI